MRFELEVMKSSRRRLAFIAAIPFTPVFISLAVTQCDQKINTNYINSIYKESDIRHTYIRLIKKCLSSNSEEEAELQVSLLRDIASKLKDGWPDYEVTGYYPASRSSRDQLSGLYYEIGAYASFSKSKYRINLDKLLRELEPDPVADPELSRGWKYAISCYSNYSFRE